MLDFLMTCKTITKTIINITPKAKLGDLKAKGLITEEGFQKMKTSVLAKM